MNKIGYNNRADLRNGNLQVWRSTQVGRRGAPAKGVGRDNRRESSNLSFSAKKQDRPCVCLVFCFEIVEFELEAPGTGKGEQEKTIEYRFFVAKEPKQGVEGASVSSDTQRLCDASGGEALQISPSPPKNKTDLVSVLFFALK